MLVQVSVSDSMSMSTKERLAEITGLFYEESVNNYNLAEKKY